jgi:hypothetical protein
VGDGVGDRRRRADQGWERWITVPAAIAGAAIVLVVLWACIPRAGESIEEIR